jgi:RHS repeat-associated protein
VGGGSATTLAAVTYDHQGSPYAEITLAAGMQTQIRKTDPFGGERLAGPTASRPTTHQGFLGATRDDDTGFTMLGARLYDPVAGRFLSADPVLDLADPLQRGGYAYAHNNPITFSDPTGLSVSLSQKEIDLALAGAGLSSAMVAAAKGDLNRSMSSVVISAAGSILRDFLGIDAIMGCIGGSIWSCAEVLSLTKKIYSAVKKVFSAVSAWRKAKEQAKKVIAKANAAIDKAKKEKKKREEARKKAAQKKKQQAAQKKQTTSNRASHSARKTGNSKQKSSQASAAPRSSAAASSGAGKKSSGGGGSSSKGGSTGASSRSNGGSSGGGDGNAGGGDDGRTLNLGAGDNPMPGATNVDLNPGHPDVMQADANNLPFDDGTFNVAHAVNPYGFNPVSGETARVMARGGTLVVSAAKRNKFRKASEDAMREAGFELIGQGAGVHPDHMFGTMRRADGGAIDPSGTAYEWRMYRRL